jgi:hypothetical protein
VARTDLVALSKFKPDCAYLGEIKVLFNTVDPFLRESLESTHNLISRFVNCCGCTAFSSEEFNKVIDLHVF